MSLTMKQFFGAGLLTLAIVGGTTTYLTSTLQAPKAAVETVASDTTQQQPRHAEVTVTEGWAS